MKRETISHHHPIDAHLVTEQQLLCQPAPSFPAGHDATWAGVSLGSVGFSYPGCPAFQTLVHPKAAHGWDGVSSRKSLGSEHTLLSHN